MPESAHSQSPRVTPTTLFLFGIFVQLLSIIPLWGHESTSPTFLNRYSTNYGVFLLGSIVVGAGWLVTFYFREPLFHRLQGISQTMKISAILVTGFVVVIIWSRPIEVQLRAYLALNWLAFAGILIYSIEDSDILHPQRWRLLLVAGLLIFLIPIFITSMTGMNFSPDEAHWADISTSPFVADGMYARTWIDEPLSVKPGIGWSVAAYGWTLENIAFDLRTGRIWQFLMYGLAIAGVGVVSHQLFGRGVAIASMSFAILSLSFFPIMDYRPDQQLPLVCMLILLGVVQARYGKYPLFWHFLAGLLATLSLQLHAAGIVYAVAFSAFYLLEALYTFYRLRTLEPFRHLIIFGIGAGLGTGIYFVFNILPVGGVSTFLESLVSERFAGERTLFAGLEWTSLFEIALVIAGFGYLLWRRGERDRFFLNVFVLIVISGIFLDSQGYLSLYQTMMVIPVGVLLARGFQNQYNYQLNFHILWIGIAILAMLFAQMGAENIRWHDVGNLLRTGNLPRPIDAQIGELVAEHLEDDDVLVSTHLLIWGIPNRPDFYSVSGEITAMRRWELDDPIEAWQRIQPTIIVDVENRMLFPPGVQDYVEVENFVACDSIHTAGTIITIYRRECI